MIKAIVFDLNGIFLQSPKLSERFHKDFNIPPSVFLPKLSDIMKKVRQPGALPAFNFWKEIFTEWKINFTEKDFWNYWFGGEIQSDKMIEIAQDLKNRGFDIFILSNNFKERSNYYEQYPWLHDLVKKVYFSWKTGFIKPDVRAWQLLLEENNLKGEECIYFDDQEANIKSAESLGIKSYLFTNEEDVKNILKELKSSLLN